MMLDPRVNGYLRLINQLQTAVVALRGWPKQRAEGPSGSGPSSSVLINVTAVDLADQIHAVLVALGERIAEERGIARPDIRWSTWARTPAGTRYATGGNTALVAGWLRRHGTWIVEQGWWSEDDGARDELVAHLAKAKKVLGVWRPPASLVHLAIEHAAAGASRQEVEDARAEDR